MQPLPMFQCINTHPLENRWCHLAEQNAAEQSGPQLGDPEPWQWRKDTLSPAPALMHQSSLQSISENTNLQCYCLLHTRLKTAIVKLHSHSPPRSMTDLNLDRSNAVTMSWPSMTQVEFISPMNFSISSSDLKQNSTHRCQQMDLFQMDSHEK